MKRLGVLFFGVMLMLLSGCGRQSSAEPRGRLELSSRPAGAQLCINGRELGAAPASFQVRPGDYLIKFSAPGYQPEWRALTVAADQTLPLAVELRPITASVLIVSKPAGARILMDEQLRGTTPLVLNNLGIGKYTLRAEKAGVTPRVVEWEITEARPQAITISLESNVGQLEVITNPVAAKLYVDDRLLGDTPYRGELEEGSHRVRLEKPGFRTREDTIQIERDRKLTYRHEFSLKPGSLEVTSTPSGAVVRLNGKGYGSTPLEIPELETGNYQVGLELAGYTPQTKTVEVVPGNRAQLAFELEKSSGGIDLVVNPPGAVVYLNRKRIGVAQEGNTSGRSGVMELRDLEPGEYEIQAVHQRARPERVTIKVQVNKGEIARPEPLELWVANAEIKLRSDGRVYTGVLRAEGEDTIIFSPEPAITEYHRRSNLVYIKKLKNEE